ncbi:MAG: hypothetical protein GTN64_05440 [Candidatus Latescibacteria bacterium]|nr:hypothetical protein [Candidatus Latescibacterota bacterium]NIO78053.1 hypothetical protein [Candidatus Latescibacterota bacterium]
MSSRILERFKVAQVLAPSSDVYNGNPATSGINMANYDRVTFVLSQVTAGTNTGTATVTVEEATDTGGTGATAIGFNFYRNEGADADDDLDAEETATTSGFSTTANVTATYMITVKAEQLSDGSPYVRLQLTESVDDPVIGEVIAICEAKEAGDPDTLRSATA